MDFARNVLSHVPLWVWAIFGYIVLIGLKQSKETRLTLRRLIVLPGLWLCFGAWGVIGRYGLLSLPTAAWLAGLAIGLGLGLGLMLRSGSAVEGARLDAEAELYVVPGSWLPLGLMLSIFVAKFAQGVLLSMHPQWASLLIVQLVTGLGFGTISGCMLGRTARILQVAHSPSQAAFA
ncbi:MAG: hypothetical protein JO006_02880 [Paucibacter sp.]|nr:hypothetical protein [Roseateles sp.]